MPSGTPTTIDNAMPMTKARSVMSVALCQDAVCTRSTAAASTSMKRRQQEDQVRPADDLPHTHQTSSEAIIGTR